MKFWALIIAAAMIWGGGQAVYTNVTNLEPTSLSLAEYEAQKPDAAWLNISGGTLDVLSGSFFTSSKSGGTASEVYLPLLQAGAEDSSPIHILYATKDAEIVGTYNKLFKMEEAELLAFIVANRDKVFINKDISGLVRFGIDLDDDEVSKLRGAYENLAADFVIIDGKSKPQWGLAAMLPIGLLILWFFFLRGGKQEEAGEAA